MIRIFDRDGAVIRRSANLRGIIDYSRDVAVERVDLFGPNSTGGGTMGVTWVDGSTCLADFASFTVMSRWASKRRQFALVIRQAHPGPGADAHIPERFLVRAPD